VLRLLWPGTTCLQPCRQVGTEAAVQLALLPRAQLLARLAEVLQQAGGDQSQLARCVGRQQGLSGASESCAAVLGCNLVYHGDASGVILARGSAHFANYLVAPT
jgi:hypothetical protein